MGFCGNDDVRARFLDSRCVSGKAAPVSERKKKSCDSERKKQAQPVETLRCH